MAATDVRYHFRNKKRIKARGSVAFGKIKGFVLKGIQTSNAAAPNNAYFVFIDRGLLQTAVGYGFNAGGNAVPGKGVEFSGLFFIEVLFGIKSFYLAGKTGFKF